jgi:hypothetical protein
MTEQDMVEPKPEPELVEARKAARTVGNAFLRGLGYSLARQLVNALVRALR